MKEISAWVAPMETLPVSLSPIAAMQKKHFGAVLNPTRWWGRMPRLFWLVALFVGYLERRKARLTPVLRSLLMTRVSQICHCAFCIDANSLRLAERSGALDKVQAISDWQNSTLFSEEERAALAYAEAVTATPPEVDENIKSLLKRHFTEETITEMTALIAFQNLSARFNAALDKPFITPDGLTLAGFAIGVLALPFLALGWYPAALIAIVLNRLLDGLDGALARRRGLTDAGGFLDIALDFLFYALVPFGFALAAPADNAIAAAWLLFAFMGTGSSFLAFAALAGKHDIDNPGYAHKSLYYIGGLTEGTETIALFVLCSLFPAHFALFAWVFGALCWLTTTTRIWSGYITLKSLPR
ncbi:carboxymuconolactone decarboxylase family protein [Enterobacter cloacae]|nr:carboxymuconolactone decarboxylase family protein [Enterobacter cloacae]